MNERMDETDFRALVEQLPLVVYVDALDERSTPLYVSPQIESLLGYTATEWHADSDLYVRSVHADDRARVLAEIAGRNGGAAPMSHDYRLHARDGSVVWVRDEEVVVRDANGAPLHAAGYLQDVTAEHHESMRLELLVGVLETATSGADADEVTRAVVEELGTRFSDVRVTYATISGSTLECRYASDGDERRDELSDTDLSEWYRATIARGESVVVSDVQSDPRVEDAEWLVERGILAYVDAPVRTADQLLGVLCFDSAQARVWSAHEIRTFSEVADQLGVILSDARSRSQRDRAEHELVRRDAILVAVNRVAAQLLAEPDWEIAAPGLLERLGVAVGASRAYLFENGVGPDGRALTSQRFEWVEAGIEPQLENALLQNLSLADSGLARFEEVGGADLIFTGVVSELPDEEREHFEAQQIKAMLTVPIFVAEAWWGFIGFDDCVTERVWTIAEIDALRLAASLIAAAIGRERSQTALREHEHKLRAVFETSLDAVLVMDDTRHFVDVNPAACDLFGISKRDLLGRTLDDFLPAERLATIDEAWGAFLVDESLIEDRHIQRLDGTLRQIEGAIRPNFLPSLHIVFLHDVTERKKLEAELLGAQKLESIGRLAGGVAHDFNNLLTAISGYTSLLLDRTNGDLALAHDLGEIHRAAERATQLTRQLLAFGRRQVLQPRALDLNEALGETGSLLRRLLGEHVELELRPASALGTVRVDPGQIEQVIVNLAVNARDAMPSGGRLTISTRELELETGPTIELEVTDTGIGMDEATQAQIFEPFFTTRAEGTGLGLASVYGIVSQSGGTITVESLPGEGSTFRVRLPRVAEAPLPPEAAPKQLDVGGSETILLVEDEDVVRALTRRVLERCGYTVLACANGSEAIELAERDSQRIDLLLTDVVMPGLRGPEVAARVAASRPTIKVLYMSGYADEALLGVAAFDENALIEKPFAVDVLARRVREALESGVENGR